MSIQKMTKKQLIEKAEALNARIEEMKREISDRAGQQAIADSPKEDFLLFHEAHVRLCITDMEGNILVANKALQEFFGFSQPEIEKMNIANLFVASDRCDRLVDMFNETKRVRNFEIKMKKKDGNIITALFNTKPIDLSDREIVLVSVCDITQQNRIQGELTESEGQYRVLFKNVPMGITVTNFTGKVMDTNQAMQEMTGYTEEELKDMNVLELYMNKERRKDFLDATERNESVRDFEATFRHKDGHEISVLINTDVIVYNNIEKTFLNSIRDITHIVKSEEELKRERDFSNAILDTTASLIIVLNREGRITKFNRACEINTGFTFEEMKGRYTWDELFGDPEKAKNDFQKLLSGNYPIRHEGSWLCKDGTRRLSSWTTTVLPSADGKAEYIIATGIDITERKMAEIEIQQANKKLSEWVSALEERTAEMKYISEMGEQLQSCQTVAEACSISAQYIRLICPDSHGAIYLINPSRNLAEAYQMWGEPVETEEVFLPENCWAMRRNRLHLVDETHPGLLCEHITGSKEGVYLCAPMMAQGEVIGILHLNGGICHQGAFEADDEQHRKHKTEIITEVAEHIALALSNLKLREALRQQSIRDILTGLYNRRYMEETLTRELIRAERDEKPVGIIMFDIDHFKDFNDMVGHDGGDALLRELGAFLLKSIRGGDIVCRYGGEEFVAVLPGADADSSRVRAEELRRGTKELLVYHLGKPLGTCTISLGVSAYPEHGRTSQEILKSADNALYRAKNEGRDRVVVAPATT